MAKELQTSQNKYTVCVKDGKTYLLTSKIEKKGLDGSYIACGKTSDGRDCLIRWFIPYPVDFSNPSDWEEADEVIIL